MTHTPTPPSRQFHLGDDEARVTVAALRAYLSETEHYLRGSGFEPCAPECPHCAPRVEHFATVRAGLEERRDAIFRALVSLPIPGVNGPLSVANSAPPGPT